MDQTLPTQLGLTIRVNADMASAQERTTQALKAEGFGVLTEIDVQETFKKKLGVEFRPYKILGACNPALSYRALETTSEVGLLLPCNVTLSEVEQGVIEVSAVDPLVMLGAASNPGLQPVAEEARARLARVVSSLQEA